MAPNPFDLLSLDIESFETYSTSGTDNGANDQSLSYSSTAENLQRAVSPASTISRRASPARVRPANHTSMPETTSAFEPTPRLPPANVDHNYTVVQSKKKRPMVRGNLTQRPTLAAPLQSPKKQPAKRQSQKPILAPRQSHEKKGREPTTVYFGTAKRKNFTANTTAKPLGDSVSLNRRLPPQILADVQNSEAVSAWRMNKPPTESYELPKNFDPRIPHKDILVSRSGRHFPMLDYVAAKTNTYMTLNFVPTQKSIVASIWGKAQDVDNAKKHIDWWIRQTFPPQKHMKHFPKIASLQDYEWTLIERIAQQDDFKQRFRRAAPEGEGFAHLIYLRLPSVMWSLHEVLGRNLEALDQIRTECCCYVMLIRDDPNPELKNCLQILCNDKSCLQQACRRILGVFAQQDARQLARPQWWILKQCEGTSLHDVISLQQYQRPSPMQVGNGGIFPRPIPATAGETTPRLIGDGLIPKEARTKRRLKSLAPANSAKVRSDTLSDRDLKCVEATTMTTLQVLKHYRGSIQMRASLGTTVLTAYPKECGKPKVMYQLEEFEELLSERNREENRLDGYVTKELAFETSHEYLLERLQTARNFLVPLNIQSQKADELKPLYILTIVIADLANEDVCYQVELEYQEMASSFERVKKRWLKLDPGQQARTPLMDINMTDIEGGPSYHFGISAANNVDDGWIPDSFHGFVRDIKIVPEVAKDPKNMGSFFRWPLTQSGTSTAPIVSMQQKRAWRFSFINTDYIVELATIQEVAWSKETRRPQPYEARWAVSMWHANWDMWLSNNADLGIGEEASWNAEECFFFPADQSPTRDSTGTRVKDGPKRKLSAEEREDLEIESMFHHAGSGFQTLIDKLVYLEHIIEGKESRGGSGKSAPLGKEKWTESSEDEEYSD